VTDSERLVDALTAGAIGWLYNDTGADEIVRAVHAAAAVHSAGDVAA
jgi:DNA-binding NarL/FixJ family response regulator